MDELPPPSVELSSIVPDETRPPTVLLSRRNLGSFFQSSKNVNALVQGATASKLVTASRFKSDEPPLTDRYGFICQYRGCCYRGPGLTIFIDDIQHASMLKDASVAGAPAPASLNGHVVDVVPEAKAAEVVDEEEEGWIEKRRRRSLQEAMNKSSDGLVDLCSSRRSIDSTRSTSKESVTTLSDTKRGGKTPDSGTSTGSVTRTTSRSPSHLRLKRDSIRGEAEGEDRLSRTESLNRRRSPSNLLNPSPARAVTAKDHLTVSARGAGSLVSNTSSPATKQSISSTLASTPRTSPTTSTSAAGLQASRATVSSLLDQLTEIHDRQQKDRKSEWDAFLRKRNKHRATSSEAQGSRRTDGMEGTGGLIGVNAMGLGGKTGVEERKAFARLVRGSIPLAYRSDVWAGKRHPLTSLLWTDH